MIDDGFSGRMSAFGFTWHWGAPLQGRGARRGHISSILVIKQVLDNMF